MNLAYKKILGKFSKVLGFGKTPPPCWEKFPNNPIFFSERVLNGAVSGSMFTGIKMVGDRFVPAGEESTIINTVDENNTADTINVNSPLNKDVWEHGCWL